MTPDLRGLDAQGETCTNAYLAPQGKSTLLEVRSKCSGSINEGIFSKNLKVYNQMKTVGVRTFGNFIPNSHSQVLLYSQKSMDCQLYLLSPCGNKELPVEHEN